MGPRWLADYRVEGEVAFRIGRDERHFIAEWPNTLRLVARRDGSVVEIVEAPGADPRDLTKIRRGGVVLLLRHLRGQLGFHGASVRVDGRAIALLGRSRQGKSTLCAALCQRDDAALFGDDALILDEQDGQYLVAASEGDHWLDSAARAVLRLGDDGASDGAKRPVKGRSARGRAPLCAFVDLVFDDAVRMPRIERLGGIEALSTLVPQIVRFVLDEPGVQRAELESLGRLVDRVSILRLTRPRDLALLDTAVDTLLAELLPSRNIE